MNRANQPSALRSLGVGALIGGLGLALVALLAGCDSTPVFSPVPANPPPMPRTNAVILAVESQRSTLRTALAAPGDTNPVTLTVRTSAPVSISAAAPIVKRGSLSLAWNPSPSHSVVGYRLYYGTNTQAYYASAAVGNATSATLKGLDEGQRYFVSAVAYDAAGTESTQSNEASGVTPIYVGLSHHSWMVSAYGVVGKTNLLQASTNLTAWETIHEWVGNGNAVSVLHTNRVQSWFRVESLP